jgi:hypothetical protein
MTRAPGVPPSSIDVVVHNLELMPARPGCAANIRSISSSPVRFEVEVRVGQPLDSTARQFLDSVMRSANRVVAYRADGDGMVVTVEAHALDEAGAKPAAIREVARIYPNVTFEVVGEPRLRSISRDGRRTDR